MGLSQYLVIFEATSRIMIVTYILISINGLSSLIIEYGMIRGHTQNSMKCLIPISLLNGIKVP